jgi:hypothetical protein
LLNAHIGEWFGTTPRSTLHLNTIKQLCLPQLSTCRSSLNLRSIPLPRQTLDPKRSDPKSSTKSASCMRRFSSSTPIIPATRGYKIDLSLSSDIAFSDAAKAEILRSWERGAWWERKRSACAELDVIEEAQHENKDGLRVGWLVQVLEWIFVL